MDPQETFGKRLRQARKMRGWSLAKLREAIDNMVSVAALSKYEKGKSMASSKVLIALSEALDVSIDYLFRDFSVSLERIRFRKLSTLPKKEIHKVQELGRDFFEKYLQLEEIVGDQRKFKPIFKKGDEIGDIEEMAEKVRSEWNLGQDPIPNVHALLEDNGIKVWFSDDIDPAFNGFSAFVAENKPVVAISSGITAARKRMTTLHELAHIVLEPLIEGMNEQDEEKLVKPFTGALLLPRKALIDLVGEKRSTITVGELLQIKYRYGISMAAIMVRARDVGIISHSKMVEFFKRHSGWRKEEPKDKELGEYFCEKNDRYKQLVFRAYGEGQVTLSQASDFLNKSLDKTHEILHEPLS